MKTIKLIFSILTLFFAITVLGCNNIALPENKIENLPQQEYYTINLNKQYSLRSAMPDINLDNYYCIATLQSAEGSSIQTLASNSGTNINTITTKKLADSMAIVLTYYETDAEPQDTKNFCFSGTSSSFTKDDLQNQDFTVTVRIMPVTSSDNSTGLINLKVQIPETKEFNDFTVTNNTIKKISKTSNIVITDFKAELYKYPDFTLEETQENISITQNTGTIDFNNRNISTGLYLLKITVTDDQENTAKIIEGLNVWANATTNRFTESSNQNQNKIIDYHYFLSKKILPDSLSIKSIYKNNSGHTETDVDFVYNAPGGKINSSSQKYKVSELNDYVANPYCVLHSDYYVEKSYADSTVYSFTIPLGLIVDSARIFYSQYEEITTDSYNSQTLYNNQIEQTFDPDTRIYTITNPASIGYSGIELTLMAQNGTKETFSIYERNDSALIKSGCKINEAMTALLCESQSISMPMTVNFYFNKDSPLDGTIKSLKDDGTASSQNKTSTFNLIFDNSVKKEFDFTSSTFLNLNCKNLNFTKTAADSVTITSNGFTANIISDFSEDGFTFNGVNYQIEFSGENISNFKLNGNYNGNLLLSSEKNVIIPQENCTGSFTNISILSNINFPVNKTTNISGYLELNSNAAILDTSPISLKIKISETSLIKFKSDSTDADLPIKTQPVYSLIKPTDMQIGTRIMDVSTFPSGKFGYSTLEEYLNLFQIKDESDNILNLFYIDEQGNLNCLGPENTTTFMPMENVQLIISQDSNESNTFILNCRITTAADGETNSPPTYVIVNGILISGTNSIATFDSSTGKLKILEKGKYSVTFPYIYNGIAYSQTFDITIND